MRRVILLSGRTCNGKSQLAKNLAEKHGFYIIKTSELISSEARKRGIRINRQSLKALGDQLDHETKHRWIIRAVHDQLKKVQADQSVILDSIRKAEQLSLFRKQTKFQVTHIHLYARSETLKKRFIKRQKKRGQSEKAESHQEIDLIKTELDINSFRNDADVRIFTDRTDSSDTLVRVEAYLRLYPSPDQQCVDVLIGGQYGSEGKGQVAAYLAQEYDVLMRVGGPNAGHKAAREAGVYTYHSLPSGCRESNADILIGPGATIHIKELLKEIQECRVSQSRLFIDPQVMVITDKDRQDESDLAKAIGSTQRGGGAAASRRILGRLNGYNRARLAGKYPSLKSYIKSTHERLQKAFANGESVFLDGTQGSALSLYHGPYPYVTSRDTNVSGCLAEAGLPPGCVRRVIMVVRFTPIRVQSPKDGTSGRLKHETKFRIIEQEAELFENLEENELTSTTGRKRRVGWFEWDSFRKACELNRPTDIALTFADYHKAKNRDARRFEQLNSDTIKFVEELERFRIILTHNHRRQRSLGILQA